MKRIEQAQETRQKLEKEKLAGKESSDESSDGKNSESLNFRLRNQGTGAPRMVDTDR